MSNYPTPPVLPRPSMTGEAAEERYFWDTCVSHYISRGVGIEPAIEWANKALEARRKAFPPPKA
jgi:hypothetical protein